MPQAQIKQFHGFGVVYPDGVSGIKVVRTFTQGPSKFVNADGSVGYTTPPPTIHELFGGGFAYASGERVTKREHLEVLPGGMREKALEWFDSHGEVSAMAKEGVPPLDLDGKQRPEPVYVLSSDIPVEKDVITEDLNKQMKETKEIDVFSQVLDAVKSLAQTVKEQGEQIADLKKRPPAPRRMERSIAKHGKQSGAMKARWADPEFKAKMLAKNPALRGKVKNGKESPEGNQAV